jgi:pyoverdine/dityrosine biosynthesis protein Dit1
MSAFIVSEENLYRVINSITKIEGYTKDLKEIKEQAISQPKKLFNKLNTLNRYSISQRYSDLPFRKKGSYPFILAKYNETVLKTNKYQNLKSLRCFLYQSCEGQAEQTPLYKLLNKISSDVAFNIISETKEYQQSEWD